MRSAQDAYADFRRTRFFSSLDGLRCASILAVMMFHGVGPHAGGLVTKGYLGVSLFFAISGFLITTLLLREHQAHGAVRLRRFYLRRVLRIFPLYYAVLGLYVALVWWMEPGTPEGQQFFENLPAFLTYTSNWFVPIEPESRIIFVFAWSLATEEQFYLLWPLVLRAGRCRWAPVAFMVGMMLLGLGTDWLVSQGHLDAAWLPVRIAQGISIPIGLGCLGAYLLHHRRGFELAWRALGYSWSAPLIAALLGASLLVEGTSSSVYAVLMALLVLACTIRQDHPLALVLTWRPVQYVGTVSYGLYLLHMLARNASLLLVPGGEGPLRFLVMLAFALVAAGLSFRYYERPFLALKERFAWDVQPGEAERPASISGTTAGPAR